MDWLRRRASRLNANTPQMTTTLFGLSALLILFALTDLVFRHLMGLPKDTALYLSILSETALLSLWMHRLQTRAPQAEPPTEVEKS